MIKCDLFLRCKDSSIYVNDHINIRKEKFLLLYLFLLELENSAKCVLDGKKIKQENNLIFSYRKGIKQGCPL